MEQRTVERLVGQPSNGSERATTASADRIPKHSHRAAGGAPPPLLAAAWKHERVAVGRRSMHGRDDGWPPRAAFTARGRQRRSTDR